jgi:arylsulfatase A-like enzyme
VTRLPVSPNQSLVTHLILGDTGIPVSHISPISREFLQNRPLDAVSSKVQIDLGRYRGKEVRFKWTLEGGAGKGAFSLVGLKLTTKFHLLSRNPDILLICVDALRYDHAFTPDGAPLLHPLKTLHSGSVVYRWAFSNATWTLPSMASVLTGLFPQYHYTGARIRNSPDPGPNGKTAGAAKKDVFHVNWGGDIALTDYPKELTPLPEILQGSGYTTALVSANPLYYASGLSYDGFDLAVSGPLGSGEAINRAAEAVLEHVRSDQPLFLMLHYMDVHDWQPKYFQKTFPRLSMTANNRKELLQSYGAAVQDVASALDAFLSTWSSRRGLDGAMVVFFADHGEQIFDPALGHGNAMGEVLLHVPLLVKYPQGTVRSGLVRRNASLVDIAPTVVDIAGIPYEPSNFSGISLREVGERTGPDERVLFADFQLYNEELSSARRGPFKIIVHPESNRIEFLNWRAAAGAGNPDPASKEIAEQALRGAFQEYRRSSKERRKGLDSHAADREKMLQTLKSLGYVQGRN